MQKLAVMVDSPAVYELVHRLAEASIAAQVTRESGVTEHYLGGPRRAVIWIDEDADRNRALEIVRDLPGASECGQAVKATIEDVQCPHCHEPVPGDFDVCWNCGRSMD